MRVLEDISKFVAENSKLVLALTLLIVILFLFASSQARFTSLEYKNMFPVGDRVYERYQLYQKDFGIKAERIYLMIKGDDVIDRKVYEYMLELERELKNVEGVGNVVSPASIIVKVYGKLPNDETTLKYLTETYASQLVPKKTLALISITLTETSSEKTKEIARQIERIIEFSNKPMGIRVEMTGSPVLRYQIIQATQRETGLTTSASIVLMIILLVLSFSGVVRKKYTVFIPLIVSILSVIVVVGVLSIAGVELDTMISASLPILIGLAIEYACQVQNRYEHERMRGMDRDRSVVISVTRTGVAVILAMLTTVIGFMSMATTLIPEFILFAVTISLGLVVAYILSISFLPATLKLLDREEVKGVKRKEVGALERILTSIASFTASKPKLILILALAVVLAGGYANTLVKLETDTKKYYPENLPAMVRFKELESVMGKQYVYTIVLPVDELSVDEVRKVDELGKYIINREDMVYRVDSLSTLIKNYFGTLPKNDLELSEILSRIPKDVLKRYVSGHLLSIYLYTSADTHDKRVELTEHLKRDVVFFGLHEFYVTGEPVIMAHLGETMLNSQTQMTLVAYVLIVLLLFATYRSISKSIVPLVAITTVIGILNLSMVLMGIKQTFMSVAINSISLGLGIDFSIHMTERYMEERRRHSPKEAVMVSIEETGKAIVTSALTMAGGFGALMLSTFPMLWNFGFLSCVAILFSLIGALTVVPAFLMITERFSTKI